MVSPNRKVWARSNDKGLISFPLTSQLPIVSTKLQPEKAGWKILMPCNIRGGKTARCRVIHMDNHSTHEQRQGNCKLQDILGYMETLSNKPARTTFLQTPSNKHCSRGNSILRHFTRFS